MKIRSVFLLSERNIDVTGQTAGQRDGQVSAAAQPACGGINKRTNCHKVCHDDNNSRDVYSTMNMMMMMMMRLCQLVKITVN